MAGTGRAAAVQEQAGNILLTGAYSLDDLIRFSAEIRFLHDFTLKCDVSTL